MLIHNIGKSHSQQKILKNTCNKLKYIQQTILKNLWMSNSIKCKTSCTYPYCLFEKQKLIVILNWFYYLVTYL